MDVSALCGTLIVAAIGFLGVLVTAIVNAINSYDNRKNILNDIEIYERLLKLGASSNESQARVLADLEWRADNLFSREKKVINRIVLPSILSFFCVWLLLELFKDSYPDIANFINTIFPWLFCVFFAYQIIYLIRVGRFLNKKADELHEKNVRLGAYHQNEDD